MPSARRGKATKAVKRRAPAGTSKSAQRRPKVKPVSRRRTNSVFKTSSRPEVKSRTSASRHPIKRVVAKRRNKSKSREMDILYDMTVEEIEITPPSESHLQTDFWAPEIRKP
jgi:hypothetical protein